MMNRFLDFANELIAKYRGFGEAYGPVALIYPEEEQVQEPETVRAQHNYITNLYHIQNLREENYLYTQNLTFLTQLLENRIYQKLYPSVEKQVEKIIREEFPKAEKHTVENFTRLIQRFVEREGAEQFTFLKERLLKEEHHTETKLQKEQEVLFRKLENIYQSSRYRYVTTNRSNKYLSQQRNQMVSEVSMTYNQQISGEQINFNKQENHQSLSKTEVLNRWTQILMHQEIQKETEHLLEVQNMISQRNGNIITHQETQNIQNTKSVHETQGHQEVITYESLQQIQNEKNELHQQNLQLTRQMLRTDQQIEHLQNIQIDQQIGSLQNIQSAENYQIQELYPQSQEIHYRAGDTVLNYHQEGDVTNDQEGEVIIHREGDITTHQEGDVTTRQETQNIQETKSVQNTQNHQEIITYESLQQIQNEKNELHQQNLQLTQQMLRTDQQIEHLQNIQIDQQIGSLQNIQSAENYQIQELYPQSQEIHYRAGDTVLNYHQEGDVINDQEGDVLIHRKGDVTTRQETQNIQETKSVQNTQNHQEIITYESLQQIQDEKNELYQQNLQLTQQMLQTDQQIEHLQNIQIDQQIGSLQNIQNIKKSQIQELYPQSQEIHYREGDTVLNYHQEGDVTNDQEGDVLIHRAGDITTHQAGEITTRQETQNIQETKSVQNTQNHQEIITYESLQQIQNEKNELHQQNLQLTRQMLRTDQQIEHLQNIQIDQQIGSLQNIQNIKKSQIQELYPQSQEIHYRAGDTVLNYHQEGDVTNDQEGDVLIHRAGDITTHQEKKNIQATTNIQETQRQQKIITYESLQQIQNEKNELHQQNLQLTRQMRRTDQQIENLQNIQNVENHQIQEIYHQTQEIYHRAGDMVLNYHREGDVTNVQEGDVTSTSEEKTQPQVFTYESIQNVLNHYGEQSQPFNKTIIQNYQIDHAAKVIRERGKMILFTKHLQQSQHPQTSVTTPLTIVYNDETAPEREQKAEIIKLQKQVDQVVKDLKTVEEKNIVRKKEVTVQQQEIVKEILKTNSAVWLEGSGQEAIRREVQKNLEQGMPENIDRITTKVYRRLEEKLKMERGRRGMN